MAVEPPEVPVSAIVTSGTGPGTGFEQYETVPEILTVGDGVGVGVGVTGGGDGVGVGVGDDGVGVGVDG